MCDDIGTEPAEVAVRLTEMSRRNFAALGAAAALAACAGTGGGRPMALTEAMVAVPTADGTCDAFFRAPRAWPPSPGVILCAGCRRAARGEKIDGEAARGRRLRGTGGEPVLPAAPAHRCWKVSPNFRTPAGRDKVMALYPAVTRRCRQPRQRGFRGMAGPAGCGRSAARHRHTGLLHGRALCRPHGSSNAPRASGQRHPSMAADWQPTSPTVPHVLLAASQASYLIAVARNDGRKGPRRQGSVPRRCRSRGASCRGRGLSRRTWLVRAGFAGLRCRTGRPGRGSGCLRSMQGSERFRLARRRHAATLSASG